MLFTTAVLSRATAAQNRRFLDRQKPDYESLIPVFQPESGIARNLFQICLRGKDECAEQILESLPNSFKDNITHLKQLNPDYTFNLFSDKDAASFIKEIYGGAIWSYYQRIDYRYGSARADFLRYLLIYACGGVYLDFKSSLDQPVNTFIKSDDVFLPLFWDDGHRHYLIPESFPAGEIPTGLIIGAKGNKYTRAVIKEILKRIDNYNPYLDGVGW